MKYRIRNITQAELQIAIDWAKKEGWNPGLYDAGAFYQTDPNGFFMGFLNHTPIASLSAVSYSSSFGFVGFYIVKPDYRGQGYGIELLNKALKHLQTQNIGLDGVISQQENYKKSGFKLAYRNIRFERKGLEKSKTHSSIVEVQRVPFEKILNYDNQVFPVSRTQFLKTWLFQPQSHALAVVRNNQIRGFGMIRKCYEGYKIGPLFADDEKTAFQLFEKLSEFAGINSSLFLDVPEINKKAIKLAKKLCMKPIFETARMYTKSKPNIPIEKVFGVTSLELG